jgi:hypothetical protein
MIMIITCGTVITHSGLVMNLRYSRVGHENIE